MMNYGVFLPTPFSFNNGAQQNIKDKTTGTSNGFKIVSRKDRLPFWNEVGVTHIPCTRIHLNNFIERKI